MPAEIDFNNTLVRDQSGLRPAEPALLTLRFLIGVSSVRDADRE
jgi:hypothetical protein